MAGLRRLILLAGLASVAASATGCLEPTLPLPPPSRPDVSPPDLRGITTVVGRVPGGTTAVVENLANGHLIGRLTDDGGRYTVTLPAEIDDRLAVYYYKSLTRSQSLIVVVPAAEGVPQAGEGGAGGASN
jgi:hypothetical protein